MPQFCDVALPVPLDAAFTYRINGREPVVGGRVLVPFREQRLTGIVTALHDRPPSMTAKPVHQVLDTEPVLAPELMRLGEWIARYYLAPLGEVFRTMLPLAAEVRRARVWRITDAGLEALHRSAERGSSRRSSKSAEEQAEEIRALDYLAGHDRVLESTLRAAVRVRRTLLESLLRKKWAAREDVTAARDARRVVEVVVLGEVNGKLNPSQQKLVEALRAAGERMRLDDLRAAGLSQASLRTLQRKGVVRIEEEPQDFHLSAFTPARPALEFDLSAAQRRALEEIEEVVEAAMRQRRFSVTLLHGVTGSGKTAVYLKAMQNVLGAGRSALLLVPEIGLTPSAAAHLHQVFGGQVAILHSALSADERAEQWHRIRRGEARIVVGTRSAVFSPIPDLALIVVDEEHDSSYKQEETPRYHGRDVAVMRGKLAGAAVLLSSATPSLESFHNATRGRYRLLQLLDRVEQRPLPEVELVDMRNEFQQTGEDQIFSRRLVEEIRQRLDRGEQAILLLNRRGYSAVVLCRACGQTVQCANCAISLTHHKRAQRLMCHYCGYARPVPRTCPQCGSEYVYFLGTGSEKLEERLHAAFAGARIGRLDRDTVRTRHDFERVLNALHAGELDLLVGTQMIAKGHDIHGVTLAGVVGADFALGFPDFRAAERTFQLLTQVAGRAGRGNIAGKVILQTYFPHHYAIQFAARHDYQGFYDKEVKFRRWMHYPPFAALANVLVRSDKLEQALAWAGLLGKWLERHSREGVRVLGPAAAPIPRLKRDHRYHFVLKSASREKLNSLLRAMIAYAATQKIPRTHVILDVDPASML